MLPDLTQQYTTHHSLYQIWYYAIMKQVGKQGKLWQKTRREWIKQNPPGFRDEYTCGLCGAWVHIKGMELDHIKPRGAYPELRYDLDNLQPTHRLCNQTKGSRWS